MKRLLVCLLLVGAVGCGAEKKMERPHLHSQGESIHLTFYEVMSIPVEIIEPVFPDTGQRKFIFGPTPEPNECGFIEVWGEQGADGAELYGAVFQKRLITDSELGSIHGLTSLKLIRLDYTHITDSGLQHLVGATDLEYLELIGTAITDAGLEHLMGLANLKQLGLSHTTITEGGLVHLHGLKSLEVLYLVGTKITDAGVADLQKALPKCRIIH